MSGWVFSIQNELMPNTNLIRPFITIDKMNDKLKEKAERIVCLGNTYKYKIPMIAPMGR
jgi:hypothetical protein